VQVLGRVVPGDARRRGRVLEPGNGERTDVLAAFPETHEFRGPRMGAAVQQIFADQRLEDALREMHERG